MRCGYWEYHVAGVIDTGYGIMLKGAGLGLIGAQLLGRSALGATKLVPACGVSSGSLSSVGWVLERTVSRWRVRNQGVFGLQKAYDVD